MLIVGDQAPILPHFRPHILWKSLCLPKGRKGTKRAEGGRASFTHDDQLLHPQQHGGWGRERETTNNGLHLIQLSCPCRQRPTHSGTVHTIAHCRARLHALVILHTQPLILTGAQPAQKIPGISTTQSSAVPDMLHRSY
eukprot:1157898-Pelagomonas_calceolata.AAC.18